MVDRVHLPGELEVGQVLVAVHYSGICGSQIGEIQGRKGPDAHLPHLLGHEGSGLVKAIGPGVRRVSPGDHVVLHWRPGLGIDAVPPRYSWKGRPLNAGFVTTFNEMAVVSENRVTPIPPDFPMDLAPLLGCAVTTGLGVVCNDAQVKIGESVVVLGAGGVGLNIVQGAAMASAWPVIALDRFDNRLELARKMGATHVINTERDPGYKNRILSPIGAQGADVVVDNTGNPQMIELAYGITHPRGRTILVGVPGVEDRVSLHTLALHFGKVFTGSHGGDAQPHEDIPRYVNLYQQGRLNLEDLITRRYGLEEINQAIDDMQTGRVAGRCLIEMGRSDRGGDHG